MSFYFLNERNKYFDHKKWNYSIHNYVHMLFPNSYMHANNKLAMSCHRHMYIHIFAHIKYKATYIRTYMYIRYTYVLYMGKIWQGKIFANLANCQLFTKIFLTNIHR